MTAPTMDELRAVARRLREYKCPVLPSHQTTREAVDAVVECMGLEDDEEMCTVRHFLDRLADLVDPGADTTMSAYDLLPEDDRAALDWMREHGGIEHIKEQGEALARRLSALAREAVADADPEDEAEAMDVLERAVDCRLMPEGMEWLVEAWPRFDDGEPVRFLDDFERYGDENGVSVVTMYSDGSFALNFRAYSKGERVNRPALKVLDADGVEIRVGDEVWDVETGCKRTVRSVNDNETVEFDGHENRGWFGKFFTHRAPVLAADGKPLREGEHVYHVETGAELVVKELPKPGEYQAVVVFAPPASHLMMSFDPDRLTHRAPVLAADGKPLREGETVWDVLGNRRFKVLGFGSDAKLGEFTVKTAGIDGMSLEGYSKPSDLTHERPDSWDRLEKDASKQPHSYCAEHGLYIDPYDGCVTPTNELFARDLVRRARALAERGQ